MLNANEFKKVTKKGYNTTLGTTSPLEENVGVLYIHTKARITPCVEKDIYIKEVQKIKQRFKEYIDDLIKNDTTYADDYLVQIGLSEKSVSKGKLSFLRYDIYLKPLVKKRFEEFKDSLVLLSNSIEQQMDNILLQCGMLRKT